jgi:hypothetical protein
MVSASDIAITGFLTSMNMAIYKANDLINSFTRTDVDTQVLYALLAEILQMIEVIEERLEKDIMHISASERKRMQNIAFILNALDELPADESQVTH